MALALAGSIEPRRSDPLCYQVRLHRIGATLREALVVVLRADAVGVALDDCTALRVSIQERHELVQVVRGSGPELRVSAHEQYIAQGQYEAAIRGSGLQQVDLLLQLCSL